MLEGATILLEGIGFPEGPRWHDGRLCFSDFHTKQVTAVDLDGQTETIVEVTGQPSGLGWLPDNRLLVVSMVDRRLLRLDPHGLVEVADLSNLAAFHCNDMVVSDRGLAYIGHFGYDPGNPEAEVSPAEIIMVRPDGEARIVAGDMAFPNGSVITPDGRTLIVAETLAARLTAFTIEQDGTLSRRRIWAQFDDLGLGETEEDYANRVMPDGICLDANGGIWVASPGLTGFSRPGLYRVLEGGEITHHLRGLILPIACMLGGPHGRTLFVAGLATDDRHIPLPEPNGCIVTLPADVPHAGWP